MQLTEEQEKILEAAKDPNHPVIKISACAGSGKSTTLSYIAKELGTSGIYIAYNKAIALEAEEQFPNKIKCSTIHSLAYQNTVKPLKLSLGYFGYRDIKERIPFLEKVIVIDIMQLFFSSKYIKFDDYIQDEYYIKQRYLNKKFDIENEHLYKIAKKYIGLMFNGKIPITHDGYLKLFHLLLANNRIELSYQFLAVDEIGDLVPVTYEIVKLINVDKKIMAGDKYQAIYVFNNTINAFDDEEYGTTLHMTKSFRCNKKVAQLVKAFMQEYVDVDFEFDGMGKYDKEPETTAYLFRTNSAMIGTIIDLYQAGTKFNLTRKSSQIFDLVLSLISLKPGYKINLPNYLWLNGELNKYWNDDFMQRRYGSALNYIDEEFSETDPAIKNAVRIIRQYGSISIYKAYNFAKELENTTEKHKITVSTVHASKGLQWDKVIIGNDMNRIITNILEKKNQDEELTKEDEAEFLLYYVACSRAKKQLIGAAYAEDALNTCQSASEEELDAQISQTEHQMAHEYNQLGL
jgi:superfamily I DNA/RNA helicase